MKLDMSDSGFAASDITKFQTLPNKARWWELYSRVIEPLRCTVRRNEQITDLLPGRVDEAGNSRYRV